MSAPSMKIYSFYNRAKSKPVDFDALTTYLQSLQGWEHCENFPNAGKSLYTTSVQRQNNNGHHFVDGYLKFGTYGMNQSHHDIQRIEGEEPIPSTHATTKDFYFLFYDNSSNANSNIPYFFGCQLWGRENPFGCIKNLISKNMSCCMKQLINRQHLARWLTEGVGTEMRLDFCRMPQTESELPRTDKCSIMLKGKGGGVTRLYQDKLARMLRRNEYGNFIEVCDEEIASSFNYAEGDLENVTFSVKMGNRQKNISFNKLENGVQESYPINHLYPENIPPTRAELQEEFISTITDML